MFAILLSVFAPALNHLPSAQASEHEVEVCTSQGMAMVAIDEGHDHGGQAGDVQHDGGGHCGYCGLHAGSHAFIPPSPHTAPLLPAGTALMPRLFYQSPRLLFAWTVAASRAPPALA